MFQLPLMPIHTDTHTQKIQEHHNPWKDEKMKYNPIQRTPISKSFVESSQAVPVCPCGKYEAQTEWYWLGKT